MAEPDSLIAQLRRVPLASLRVFEAAGRTGSFVHAAQEIGVSASAISHSIKKLEDLIELQLFERTTREINLTAPGRLLLEYVQRGLDEMHRGLALIKSDEPRPLRLHTAPSFGMQWLMPRLARFVAAHPDVDLRFSASTDYAQFDNDDFDLDVVYGEPRSALHEKVPLAMEHLSPLCSPALAGTLRTPQDLYQQRLIQCDVQMLQWKGWFEANRLVAPRHYALRFDRSSMAIAAAVNGMGVVLESSLLAQHELESGALVAPFRGMTHDIQYVGHYLVYPKRRTRHPAVEVFKKWLLEELSVAR
ncbi:MULTISPECIES: LysR substrate-binding domain-containing protein [unclassified Pseudomonas]|uniref:LysR substrate-binding domain-containing protein n=1 Tax=unclassified Pseudomonas TaxID=196821 RepID=UPI000BC3D166|nr:MULTISPECIES: LysR substrate-binding domain-containing protein [unclassified Pseudomonas]PVZ12277.1 DNA-binding transcriptional LysR family regulator [Pseudomonas sp. URIL14HWK12:I12]PVZ23571.1 DNA-binding transcriptional LysR family regulator [Pseudomonas sp. URIL14HWK12:I10]PVZ32901.1 DNA-binding transcriptional LysR family regulator [Pseudomonas sp. URIL14HWK12:I11]SNZ18769.1 DNA-binding transcriptional regulator, LysR family [Pseudomonas sp. URIL14HWK12:I9]